MKAYIISSKSISPQDSFSGTFPWEQVKPDINLMSAVEPNYKEYISPVKIRRMNRIVKMGIATAQSCLKDAGIDKPMAIITGTGWGCLSDTYDFLTEIKDNKEDGLSPATFIQSTHNTVGGQIALYFDCQEYNNVYVSGKTSFEQSLLDALILINEEKEDILVGGLDELVTKDIELKRAAGYWKSQTNALTDTHTKNDFEAIPGEGASFFLLSSSPDKGSNCCIEGVWFLPDTYSVTEFDINTRRENGEIDLVLSGFNGDPALQNNYFDFYKLQFPNALILPYKLLCGEYDTASAFALWFANQICVLGSVPSKFFTTGFEPDNKKIKRIIIHQFTELHQHAIIVVSKTDI